MAQGWRSGWRATRETPYFRATVLSFFFFFLDLVQAAGFFNVFLDEEVRERPEDACRDARVAMLCVCRFIMNDRDRVLPSRR